MAEKYLTVKEAAEMLRLSESRLYHLRNKLPHIKCGNSRNSRVLFISDKLVDAYQNI